MVKNAIAPRRLLGRCANGAERDTGRVAHAVQGANWSALCGAKPGRRSAGWSEYEAPLVTCARCARRWAKLEPIEVCQPEETS
jgi:hypothetical protein